MQDSGTLYQRTGRDACLSVAKAADTVKKDRKQPPGRNHRLNWLAVFKALVQDQRTCAEHIPALLSESLGEGLDTLNVVYIFYEGISADMCRRESYLSSSLITVSILKIYVGDASAGTLHHNLFKHADL